MDIQPLFPLISGATAFMSASQTAKEIIKALVNLNPIQITYRDRFGRVTRRRVEPYALGEKYGKNWIFGYCKMRDDSKIRSFLLSRIKRVDVIETENFRARWDIEARPPYEVLAKEMAEDMGFFDKPKKKGKAKK